MAAKLINLSATGLTISDIVWDWCKKMSDGSSVSTTGAALTERGEGWYCLTNPNVTEDTDFKVHRSGDANNYAVNMFAMPPAKAGDPMTLTSVYDAAKVRFRDGKVYCDTSLTAPGTDYPLGEMTSPVNNLVDAKTIANTNGLKVIHLKNELWDELVFDFSGFTIEGSGFNGFSQPIIYIGSGSAMVGADFRACQLYALSLDDLDYLQALNCTFIDLIGGSYFIKDSEIYGGCVHAPVNNCIYYNCCSTTNEDYPFILDLDNTIEGAYGPGEMYFGIEKWNGFLEIQNTKSWTRIDMLSDSGRVTIDSSCTAGIINIYCDSRTLIVDNSDGAIVIIHDTENANIVSVQGVAVTNIDDFKADVSDLATIDDISEMLDYFGIISGSINGTQTSKTTILVSSIQGIDLDSKSLIFRQNTVNPLTFRKILSWEESLEYVGSYWITIDELDNLPQPDESMYIGLYQSGPSLQDMIDGGIALETSVLNVNDKVTDIHDETFGRWIIDPVDNTLTLYRSGGEVLKVFDLTETTAQVPAYIERTPQ